MTIQEALLSYSQVLNEANIDVPSLDTEVLISYVLQKDKVFLYAHPEQDLSQEEQARLKELIERRKTGYPLAYLTKNKAFYDLDFYVDERVLIPRPETEMIVTYVLDHLNGTSARIADIGCGSGAISVTLAKHLPKSELFALDISEDALDVAKQNAKTHHIENISFFQSHLLEALPQDIDILVANVPYVKTEDVESIIAEPREALDGGDDGLDVFFALFAQLKEQDIPLILLEIGFDQSIKIEELARTYLPDYRFSVEADYAGFPRMVILEKQNRK